MNSETAPGDGTEGSRGDRYGVADLLIDTGKQQVFRDDEEIPLPRLSFELLMALVRAAPNTVSQDELMRQVWAGLVVSPETVTQRVKLLRDALGDDSQSPRYVGLVRGRGYRLVSPVERLQPPPGDAADTKAPPVQASSARRGLLAVAVAVAAAALLVAATWWGFEHAPDPGRQPANPPDPSIAVLPFDSLSPEAREHDYFAAGMHDDLLTHLSQIEGLRVIARGSVLSFEPGRMRIRDIGRELGVTHVLEGSVQQVGLRVRVNVQLIETKGDAHLWAKIYDRDFSPAEVLDIQDDISRSVAEALRLTLLTESSAPQGTTTNVEAYALYVTGQGYRQRAWDQYVHKQFVDLLLIAEDHFRRALALDPGFALAHAALARVLAEIYWQNARPDAAAAKATATEALAAAEQALKLAPGLPEGHLGLAYYYYYGLRDFPRALAELGRAENHMPADPGVLSLKLYLLRRLGRVDEFIDTAARAQQLAPRDLSFARLLAWGLRLQRRLDEAEAVYADIDRIEPGSHEAVFGLAVLRYLRDGAIAPLADTALGITEDFPQTAWQINWAAGDLQACREILERTAKFETEDSPPLNFKRGLVELAAGDRARAHDLLELARSELEKQLEQSGPDTRDRDLMHLSQVLAALGDEEAAVALGRSVVERIPAESDRLMGPIYLVELARVYGLFGRRQEAIEALERALAQPIAPSAWNWQHDPWLAGLRGEPGFESLVERYGVPYRQPVADASDESD